MKVFNIPIPILFLLVAVKATPNHWISQPTSSHSQELTPEDDFFELIEEINKKTEELIVDSCEGLAQIEDNSVKTIITVIEFGNSNSCIKDISRILDSANGALIIIGSDKSSLALTCLKIDRSNLFYNKHYVLPQSIQRLIKHIYTSGELNIKVFVTSKMMTEQLYALIRDSKYEEAVDLSILLNNDTFESLGKKVIDDTVLQLLDNQENSYLLMNYAFKLIENDAKYIVADRFPPVFIQLFDSQESRILNKERTGALRLTPEKDYYGDRWAYSDCSSGEFSDAYWTFHPVWNTTLNSVLFEIKNTKYGMKLKMDWQTVGHFNNKRLTWGDHRPVDYKGRYVWRLIPAQWGFKENMEQTFCIVEEVYKSYLIPNSCEKTKTDVMGDKVECSPEVAWFVEPKSN